MTLLCFLGPGERLEACRELVRVTRPGGRIVIGELARHSLWALQRRLRGWRGSQTWRSARFTTARELRGLLRQAGATELRTRHGLYLPPRSSRALIRRADTIERLGRHLGPLGAAFLARGRKTHPGQPSAPTA